jgi:hypothetical protein
MTMFEEARKTAIERSTGKYVIVWLSIYIDWFIAWCLMPTLAVIYMLTAFDLNNVVQCLIQHRAIPKVRPCK